jgi:hypothetical protein
MLVIPLQAFLSLNRDVSQKSLAGLVIQESHEAIVRGKSIVYAVNSG